MKKFFFCLVVAFTFLSCNELLQVANVANSAGLLGGTVTNETNVAGLKSALNVGIDTAVKNLGASNGFLSDAAAKILLPPEAQTVVENIKMIPGGQALVDKAVTSLNAAASDAVQSAAPIFKNAITSMTISDAAGILFGGKEAATDYLRQKTYDQLTQAFAPKVAASLGKPLVGGVSTTKSWESLASAYNAVANNPLGAVAGLKPVNVNLEQYVTQKALDALFVKIANEENAIRTNPAARTTQLLQTVFGQLDKK